MKTSLTLFLLQVGLTLASADNTCQAGSIGDRLASDSTASLYPRQLLQSQNGACFLAAQTDGNVVLFKNFESGPYPLWETNTKGQIYDRFGINSNGDVAVFTKDQSMDYSVVFPSGKTADEGPFTLIMQDDCNLVVYDSSEPVWASGTYYPGNGERMQS